ncbi:hypothetical protein ACTXT7_005610 [Hymenolepis weldensis]
MYFHNDLPPSLNSTGFRTNSVTDTLTVLFSLQYTFAGTLVMTFFESWKDDTLGSFPYPISRSSLEIGSADEDATAMSLTLSIAQFSPFEWLFKSRYVSQLCPPPSAAGNFQMQQQQTFSQAQNTSPQIPDNSTFWSSRNPQM